MALASSVEERARTAWVAGATLAEVPPAPRAIAPLQEHVLFARQRRMMLLLLAVWVGVGVVYYFFLLDGLMQDIAFQLSDARQVEAKVESQEKTSNSINKTKTTRIRYAYEVDGQRHEGAYETIDDDLIGKLQPGTTLDVEVARAYPWASRLPGESSSFFGLGINLLFLAMWVLPLLMLIFTGYEVRQKRSRLLCAGLPVIATVTRRWV